MKKKKIIKNINIHNKRYKAKRYTRKKHINKKNKKRFWSPLTKGLFKSLVIIFLIICILLLNDKEGKYNILKNIINNKNNSNSYFSCVIAMAKLENKYVREFVEYYKKIGLDKIYLADDNSLKSEKLSDVLQDYIDEGFVEIMDVRGKGYTQKLFFQNSFKILRPKCKWMLYFDIDEFLEFVNKNKTINNYLSEDKFNKCEVIKINWIMYVNEDLLYYDNRTLQERFTTPTYYEKEVRTVKSIVKNDSRRNPWIKTVPHEPYKGLYSCNSIGDPSPYNGGRIFPPILSYCYIKHYYYKSVEEFAYKLKKGFDGAPHNVEKKLKLYFQFNKYSKEKVELFEKILNTTLEWISK